MQNHGLSTASMNPTSLADQRSQSQAQPDEAPGVPGAGKKRRQALGDAMVKNQLRTMHGAGESGVNVVDDSDVEEEFDDCQQYVLFFTSAWNLAGVFSRVTPPMV